MRLVFIYVTKPAGTLYQRRACRLWLCESGSVERDSAVSANAYVVGDIPSSSVVYPYVAAGGAYCVVIVNNYRRA